MKLKLIKIARRKLSNLSKKNSIYIFIIKLRETIFLIKNNYVLYFIY